MPSSKWIIMFSLSLRRKTSAPSGSCQAGNAVLGAELDPIAAAAAFAGERGGKLRGRPGRP